MNPHFQLTLPIVTSRNQPVFAVEWHSVILSSDCRFSICAGWPVFSGEHLPGYYQMKLYIRHHLVDTMDDRYPFETEFKGTAVKFGVHLDRTLHEPVVRWTIPETTLSGERARVYMEQERNWPPVLYFGTWVDIPISGGETHSTLFIGLPEQLAVRVQHQVQTIGSVNADAGPVSADPAEFPSRITYDEDASQWKHPSLLRSASGDTTLEQARWDEARNVMWYQPINETRDTDGHKTTVRNTLDELNTHAYQIEDSRLVHRVCEGPPIDEYIAFEQMLIDR